MATNESRAFLWGWTWHWIHRWARVLLLVVIACGAASYWSLNRDLQREMAATRFQEQRVQDLKQRLVIETVRADAEAAKREIYHEAFLKKSAEKEAWMNKAAEFSNYVESLNGAKLGK